MSAPPCPLCGYEAFFSDRGMPGGLGFDWCGRCGHASFVSDGERQIPLGRPRKSKREMDRIAFWLNRGGGPRPGG